MTERSVKNTVIEVNPMFFVPEGADDIVVNPSSRFADTTEGDFDAEELYGSSEMSDEYDSALGDAPETPDIIRVVSQEVRTNKSGNQVIDLIIEVEDVLGAVKYDYRVTKN